MDAEGPVRLEAMHLYLWILTVFQWSSAIGCRNSHVAFWSRGTKNDRLKGTDGVQLIYPVTQTQKYNEVQRSDKSGKLEGC